MLLIHSIKKEIFFWNLALKKATSFIKNNVSILKVLLNSIRIECQVFVVCSVCMSEELLIWI